MKPRAARVRAERYTVLIVGEGEGECCLLRVLRDIYLRDGNVSLAVRNANGGSNVLPRIATEVSAAAYDAVGAMVDVDDHWGAEQRAAAATSGIVTFENAPCLEALLLSVAGERVHSNSRANKTAFAETFGCPAHLRNVIARKFTRDIFDAARERAPALDALLRFIRT